MSDETYQGWTNRETWCVSLWLANEEDKYRESRRIVRRRVADNSSMTLRLRRFRDTQDACDALRCYTESFFDLSGWNGDLIGIALSRVDWGEIVSAIAEELSDD